MKISEIFNRADFQWEIREGVVFYVAKRFADGYNPYIYHDGMPEAVYMYGFILPMIISLGFKLFGTSAFLIAEIMTMLTEMVG